MKESGKGTFWALTLMIVALGGGLIGQSIAMFRLHQKVDALAGNNSKSTTMKEDQDTFVPQLNMPTNSMIDDPMLMLDQDWDPFKEMSLMQSRIDHMFGNAFNRFGRSDRFSSLLDNHAFAPALNMEDKGDKILVTVDLPGSDGSKVNVDIKGQALTISGSIKEETQKEDKNGKILRQERRSGNFERVTTLPVPVDADNMTTKEKKGVLYITLPKKKA